MYVRSVSLLSLRMYVWSVSLHPLHMYVRSVFLPGQDLCEKLLQVVEIATPEMQREIIVALPEILDDPQHNEAAQKLK